MNVLTYEPIPIEKFLIVYPGSAIGASNYFFGTVRAVSERKVVKYLVYEAYPVMAEKEIARLIGKSRLLWDILSVKVLHRLGTLMPGEVAVAIEVHAEHRDDSFHACRFLIDSIKHEVPIWKKEYFMDGTSRWGGCRHVESYGTVTEKT